MDDRLSNLKQVEEALDVLIASNGEYCPLPLSQDAQSELFPEVRHARGERRTQRQNIAFTRKMRREARKVEQSWLLRQNLLGQAVTELNFQSPETVNSWYRRWSDEFDASELLNRPSGVGRRDLAWHSKTSTPATARTCL